MFCFFLQHLDDLDSFHIWFSMIGNEYLLYQQHIWHGQISTYTNNNLQMSEIKSQFSLF